MARVLVIAFVAAACSRASDESGTKQWQGSPPPTVVTVPAAVSIAVEVDGASRPAITTDTLEKIKPDFADAEHHVWLIASLVGDASPAGSVVEASSPAGISVKLSHPTPDGLEPVLFLTRRGEMSVRAIDPKDPFPKWEGRGSRLQRAGDSMPHVKPVAKIAITRPKP